MNAIGVFGGTFDPIHYGHLSAAWQCADVLDIPVHMVPAKSPPHRDAPGASTGQRWHMLQLAVAGHPRLIADRRELDRPGLSYMVDTLDSFANQFPDRGRCLIVGLDALAKLHLWQRWERLAELAHFIVLDRPGYPRPDTAPMAEFIATRTTTRAQDLADPGGGRLLFLPVPALQISASAIRKRLERGASAHFLMPPLCLAYAQRQQIYLATAAQ